MKRFHLLFGLLLLVASGVVAQLGNLHISFFHKIYIPASLILFVVGGKLALFSKEGMTMEGMILLPLLVLLAVVSFFMTHLIILGNLS
jgi:hypothetical protein